MTKRLRLRQQLSCNMRLSRWAFDNGLLHLAACVPGNIIFGYNIAAPSQRRPVRRLSGILMDITLTKEELSCIHCQTRMKQQNLINFRNCFYGDVACLGKLFENGSERWIRALSDLLPQDPPPLSPGKSE